MSKFKVGDKVKIKLEKVLETYKKYDGVYTIIQVIETSVGSIYKLKGVPRYGTDKLIEKVE